MAHIVAGSGTGKFTGRPRLRESNAFATSCNPYVATVTSSGGKPSAAPFTRIHQRQSTRTTPEWPNTRGPCFRHQCDEHGRIASLDEPIGAVPPHGTVRAPVTDGKIAQPSRAGHHRGSAQSGERENPTAIGSPPGVSVSASSFLCCLVKETRSPADRSRSSDPPHPGWRRSHPTRGCCLSERQQS